SKTGLVAGRSSFLPLLAFTTTTTLASAPPAPTTMSGLGFSLPHTSGSFETSILPAAGAPAPAFTTPDSGPPSRTAITSEACTRPAIRAIAPSVTTPRTTVLSVIDPPSQCGASAPDAGRRPRWCRGRARLGQPKRNDVVAQRTHLRLVVATEHVGRPS